MQYQGKWFISTCAITLLSGCAAQKVLPPKSGPTAILNVSAEGLRDNSFLKTEAIWIPLYNKDKSWGAEPMLKIDKPTDQYIVPANQALSLTFRLILGGVGYDGHCVAGTTLSLKEGSEWKAAFKVYHDQKSSMVTGCDLRVYDGDKLIGHYEGEGVLTEYKVKVITQ